VADWVPETRAELVALDWAETERAAKTPEKTRVEKRILRVGMGIKLSK